MKLLSLLMMSGILLASCENNSKTHVSQPSPFTLRFHVQAGQQDINCDETLEGLGSKKSKARLLDFRFFVYDLAFVKSDGSEILANLDSNEWQAQDVTLLDYQDKDDNCTGSEKPTNKVIVGSVSDATDIVGVRFRLGLPNRLNHADPTSVPSPLNETSMFWSWQTGYKFMRIDLAPEGGIRRPSDPDFLGTDSFFHLGSTNCAGNPARGETVTCERVNQPEIKLNGFVWGASQIRFDLSSFLSNLDLTTDDYESPGCMSGLSDEECTTYFQKLGLDFTKGESSSESPQTVFTVE